MIEPLEKQREQRSIAPIRPPDVNSICLSDVNSICQTDVNSIRQSDVNSRTIINTTIPSIPECLLSELKDKVAQINDQLSHKKQHPEVNKDSRSGITENRLFMDNYTSTDGAGSFTEMAQNPEKTVKSQENDQLVEMKELWMIAEDRAKRLEMEKKNLRKELEEEKNNLKKDWLSRLKILEEEKELLKNDFSNRLLVLTEEMLTLTDEKKNQEVKMEEMFAKCIALGEKWEMSECLNVKLKKKIDDGNGDNEVLRKKLDDLNEENEELRNAILRPSNKVHHHNG